MKTKIYEKKYTRNYVVLFINAMAILWFTYLQRNVDFTTGGLGEDWNILWIFIFIFNFMLWVVLQYGVDNRYTVELEGKIVKSQTPPLSEAKTNRD
ncbi:MAG: hypothetical protein ACFFCM_07460 [Promethearchaeota archaeon]